MTHTCSYKQQIDDCDFPLTATWSIEYQVVRGIGDDFDDVELEIVSKSLDSVVVWMTDDLGAPVDVSEIHSATEKKLAKMLDDESLMEACERHWERRGCDEELEAA